MQTSNQAVSHILQSGETEQRVEVSIEQRDGTEVVALRCSTWTEGLGWCTQKTIRLETEQLEDLHRAITVARHKLVRQRAARGQQGEPAQVIQMPSLA